MKTSLYAIAFLVAAGCGSTPATQQTTTATRTPSQERAPTRTTGGDTAAQNDRACTMEAVYFEYDSSDLDGRARDQLERSARCLNTQRSARVVVTGMTDPRGTEEYNLALGERRAQTVKQYVQALGVSTSVQTNSMGEEMAAGSDETTWVRDRRAELHPQ